MMNNLLRDMREVRDVAAFINNVMVGTETDEEHDDIVEEVLRRIVENDLFVKLEKCMCKVREVRLLEVVIELNEVKMEKEKV